MEQWLAKWKRNGWRTAAKQPVKNADLWEQLETAANEHTVRWHWVRGHDGHVENERCDFLANEAIRRRGPALLKRLAERPAADWTGAVIDIPKRRQKRIRYLEETVSLPDYEGSVRQIAVTGLDSDATPKRVTLTPRAGINSYGNLIQGLTGSSISWRLDERSSISIRGGAGDETFAIASSSLPSAIRIDGGAGINTLDYTTHAGLHGQVNWFTGDEDARGLVADDVSGQIGTLRGGAKLDVGKVRQAFSLDGSDDFVEIPDYPSQTPSSITLDAWVNPRTLTGDRVIVSKYDSSANASNKSWALLNVDGRLRFGVYQGATGRAMETSAVVLAPNKWQHVAATFDVATQAIQIYVNGVAVASNFVPGQNAPITVINDSSSPVRIGSYVGTSGAMSGFWDGRIDEVDVFQRALSAGEVQSIFAADTSGKSAVAGSVSANLRTGTASGLRGGIVNIKNVIGGAGDDILIGNGGNSLTGGAGRDLLIAGAMASFLYGGGGEDLHGVERLTIPSIGAPNPADAPSPSQPPA
jgi:hypothetical protein